MSATISWTPQQPWRRSTKATYPWRRPSHFKSDDLTSGDVKCAIDAKGRCLGLQPDPEKHAHVVRHAARPSRRQLRDAAVRFPRDEAVVGLAGNLRQEPGCDDRCRLPGHHARHARLHHAGAALLLSADELTPPARLSAINEQDFANETFRHQGQFR